MALTHLLDTSVAARIAEPAVHRRLRAATKARRIGCTSMTGLEVGFSARSQSEWDDLSRGLAIFEHVAITNDDFAAALDVQRRLAARGQRGRRIPDLVISAVAHRLDLIVLHYDSDFDLISAETRQLCEWVVPRGSIN